LEEKRTRVQIGPISPSHGSTYESASIFNSMGFDNSFDLDEFKDNFKVNILSKTKTEIHFELIGIDAAIANALRRILIAEVPTMAIEKVFIGNNTGVMQDEILSHRLGLIPINVDPAAFDFRAPNEDYSDRNCLIFELKVDCTRNIQASDDAPPHEKYINEKVYSRNFVWIPQGVQGDMFIDNPVRPVFEDILITKLRPGQSIDLNVYCEKGIGKTHAKWSPVSTAFYRLLPEITFLTEIKDELADELVQKCPMNVFDIEDLGKKRGRVAKVARPRDCSVCRECIREPEWQDRIKLSRVKNHFIFSVESVGTYDSGVLLAEAIRVLIAKIETLELEIGKIVKSNSIQNQ